MKSMFLTFQKSLNYHLNIFDQTHTFKFDFCKEMFRFGSLYSKRPLLVKTVYAVYDLYAASMAMAEFFSEALPNKVCHGP